MCSCKVHQSLQYNLGQPYLPPNFLLPSSSSLPVSTPPFLQPNAALPPFFLSPSTSHTSATSSFDDMARRKRSPMNIHWHHRQAVSHIEQKSKCQICTSNLAAGIEPKPPVENEEYFIDNDGTMTVKNGVCPRSLALALFQDVWIQRTKYEELLGENLVRFLLNLQQIVEKHQAICPDEDESQIILAQNVLQTHTSKTHFKTLNMRKRPHEPANKSDKFISSDYLSTQEKRKSSPKRDNPPDSFRGLPNPLLMLKALSSAEKKNLPTILGESPLTSHPSSMADNSKGGGSENCSSDESSRVNSPTPSMSSITSGLSLSDAAKQLSSTKRGTKILPVSSADGQTRYQCPVCSLELPNDHDLTVHIRSHNQSGQQSTPNTCTICGKTLSSQSSLDRHMLVHSGERPFKCKICDMSFTTNGNMHRHARIHEKNGTAPPKTSPGRKPSESKTPSKKDLFPYSPEKVPSIFNETDDVNFSKTQSQRPGQFYQTCYPYYFPPTHPAFSYPPWNTSQMAAYFSAMKDPTSGESLAKQPCITPNFVSRVREPSPDIRTKQVLSCNTCHEEFTNDFSLTAHMESHVIVDKKLEAENGSSCETCKTVAKSEESLLLHILTHHKAKEPLADPDPKTVKKSPTSSPTSSPTTPGLPTPGNSQSNVGFQPLGFASFTCKKFPLIAKYFCESSPGLRGSKSPLFKCRECDKEFPVEGAKDLHEASHVPEEYTVCPMCNCHFTESTRLQEHMQKHVADCKFEETHKKPTTEAAELMTQNYFLFQFGLKAKEDADIKIEPDQSTDDMESSESINGDEEMIKDENRKHASSENEEEISESNIKSSPSLKYKQENEYKSLVLPPSHLLYKHSLTSTPPVGSSAFQPPHSSRLPPSRSHASASSSPSPGSDSGQGLQESPAESMDGVMPPMFPCKYCDVVLSSPRDLKYHQRKHKETSQFQCKVCSYSSSDKSTLLRHMRTHSGERPFKCGICEYSFTTKANCERHMKQKHGLEKDQLSDKLICNKYIIADKRSSPSPTLTASSSSIGQPLDTICKVCKVDFQHWRALQQHIHVSPNCHMIYVCKLCKKPFSSRPSALRHMQKHHSDTPSKIHEKLIISIENLAAIPSNPNQPHTPPPAHSKSTISPSPSSASLESVFFKPSRYQNTSPALVAIKTEAADKPLDFSKQDVDRAVPYASHRQHLLSGSRSSSLSEEDHALEDLPIDLSVSKSSNSSPWDKGTALLNQSSYDFPRQIPHQPGTSTLSPHASKKHPPASLDKMFRKSDGNNNQLSPLYASSTSHQGANQQPLPQKLSLLGHTQTSPKLNVQGSALQLPALKHPAFPPYHQLISQYSALLPPQTKLTPPQSLSSQKLNFLPSALPSLLIPSGTLNPLVPSSSRSLFPKVEKSPEVERPEALQTVNKEGSSFPGQAVPSRLPIELSAQTATKVEDDNEDSETSPTKESSSESDSSCELASVNKILDATDAQKFQGFLMIAETEDEQEGKSESVSSGEDSNLSMENMFSISQSAHQLSSRSDEGSNARQDEASSASEEGKDLHSVTVNVALIDGSLPEVFKERRFPFDKNQPDKSNMSEQAIAELIEKVSKENPGSLTKKKRNSYADSPHKFSCPYCPRCFPWLSSLNRHLLTHTGQKPFKCPRCPVTFSTKSNRERHLIRKHNVNMLDPASRSTMDRPYKCHLCVFSSFSTQSNLVKHYKDRHSGVSPPARVLEAIDKSLSDAEGEENMQNGVGPSYEDEEEYNNLVEMRGGMSDKDIMIQNYTHDSDSNHSGNNIISARDPHKKRNAIFNLASEDEPETNGKISLNNSLSLTPPSKLASGLASRPGIDDTVLTDTMKNFLDKSVRQALEDSHRRALEEGSKFVITPAIERHLRHLPSMEEISGDMVIHEHARCLKCDKNFFNRKLLTKHLKNDHSSDLPFKCYLCEKSFSNRVECLQHQSQAHQADWSNLKEKNDIGNIQVYGTRLDKMIEKLCKKGRDILEKQVQDGNPAKTFLLTNKAELGLPSQDAVDVEDCNEDLPDTGVLDEVITTDYLQRKVHCALCPKRFWSLQDLRRHMRSHTGERPYRCDICFQKFTLKHSLNRHKAKHHPDLINIQDGSSDEEESESDEDKTKEVEKSVQPMDLKNSGHIGGNDDNNNKNNLEVNDDDMLHNLLGVESSTIDKIFESKDSAASLLGV